MKYSFLLKMSFTFAALVFTSNFLFSQECAVEKESLKGTYIGDCKKGKANGRGKAVGTDTYEGEFKSGLPSGEGIYTWGNGNKFTGNFVKGLKEGKGTLTYKRANSSDSIVDGFWKRDEYIGKNEKPYKISYTSKSITDIDVAFNKDAIKQITFNVTNTTGSGRLKVDDIQLFKGSYNRIKTNDYNTKKSETVIEDIVFPCSMRVTIGSEQIEIEFFEEGRYIVSLSINQ